MPRAHRRAVPRADAARAHPQARVRSRRHTQPPRRALVGGPPGLPDPGRDPLELDVARARDRELPGRARRGGDVPQRPAFRRRPRDAHLQPRRSRLLDGAARDAPPVGGGVCARLAGRAPSPLLLQRRRLGGASRGLGTPPVSSHGLRRGRVARSSVPRGGLHDRLRRRGDGRAQPRLRRARELFTRLDRRAFQRGVARSRVHHGSSRRGSLDHASRERGRERDLDLWCRARRAGGGRAAGSAVAARDDPGPVRRRTEHAQAAPDARARLAEALDPLRRARLPARHVGGHRGLHALAGARDGAPRPSRHHPRAHAGRCARAPRFPRRGHELPGLASCA